MKVHKSYVDWFDKMEIKYPTDQSTFRGYTGVTFEEAYAVDINKATVIGLNEEAINRIIGL